MGDIRDQLTICPDCNGDGWTSEHDPRDPHTNGCTSCPIQVGCDLCRGTGIAWKKDIPKLKIEDEDPDELPF